MINVDSYLSGEESRYHSSILMLSSLYLFISCLKSKKIKNTYKVTPVSVYAICYIVLLCYDLCVEVVIDQI